MKDTASVTTHRRETTGCSYGERTAHKKAAPKTAGVSGIPGVRPARDATTSEIPGPALAGICIVNEEREIIFANSVLEMEFGPSAGRKCHRLFFGRQRVCPWCDLTSALAEGPLG